MSNGVVCRLRSGVVYVGPPPLESGLRAWESQCDLLRLCMPLGDDPIPPRFRTLADLAGGLRERAERAAVGKADLPPKDPELEIFDRVILRLVELAVLLRQSGSWLGRVHPQNVLLVELNGGGSEELVLSDWGFAFQESLSLSGPPEWVGSLAWSILWDFSPAEMNGLILLGKRPETPGVDRRTLARLLACLLLGEREVEGWFSEADRPQRAGASLATIPAGKTRSRSPIWKGIKVALEGKSSLEDLAKAVKQDRPSRHFLDMMEDGREKIRIERQAKQTRARRRAMRIGVGIPVCLVAAAGIFLTARGLGIFDPPKPGHALCPTCPGESPLVPALGELAEAREAAEAAMNANKADFATLAVNLKPKRDAEIAALARVYEMGNTGGRTPTAVEQSCLSKVTMETWESLGHDFERLAKRLENLSDDPKVECGYLNDLASQVKLVEKLGGNPSPAWIATLMESRKWTCGNYAK